MKVKVYDINLNDYITINLPDDFCEKTMLITLPNENNEVIELPKDKITYESLISCIHTESNSFETIVNKFKTRDFLEMSNVGNSILYEISTHDDFDPEKLGFLIPLIIGSKFLSETNSVKLRNYIGYEFENDITKFDRLKNLFKELHGSIRIPYSTYNNHTIDVLFNNFCESYSDIFSESCSDSYRLFISVFEHTDVENNSIFYSRIMLNRNIILCNIDDNHVLYGKICDIKLPNINIFNPNAHENLNLDDNDKINIICISFGLKNNVFVDPIKYKTITCYPQSNFK